MSIWLWLAIVFGGSLPTFVILWSIYCRKDNENDESPDSSNP